MGQVLYFSFHYAMWQLLLAAASSGPIFQSDPGRLTSYEADTIQFKWRLFKEFVVNDYMTIKNKENTVILSLNRNGCNKAYGGTGPQDTRLSCISQGTTVGFSIGGSGVRDSDAGGYTCEVEQDSTTESDSNAFLYIYKSPTPPTIADNTQVEEGDSLTLKCSATSQSLPESESGSAVIEYTWNTTLPHTVNGSTITVGPLTRDDDGKTVICTATEKESILTAVKNEAINVIYPPGAAQLHANKSTVVKGVDDLVMTCQLSVGEEGKPNTYTYQWRNPNQQVSNNGMSLTILKNTLNADEHDGTWQCTPSNNAGTGTSGTTTITVHIASTIVKFESSHQGVLISSNSTTLTCEVESRPQAYIQLVHVGSGTELEKVNSGLRVQHTLNDVSCFDHGNYTCKTNNSVGNPDSKNITLDVRCPPSAFSSVDDKIGKGLNGTLSHSIPTLANPVITPKNVTWTFKSSNGTIKRKSLPDDVITSVEDTTHPLVKNLTIYISPIQEKHFGNYTVTATNQYGNFLMKVKLVPQGSPVAPSAPRLIKATSVSLLIEWTAGFNGGPAQRFTVMYMPSDGTTDLSVKVPTAPGISSGDVVRFKLNQTHFILAGTIYQVKVMTVNDLDVNDKKIGPEALFTTKAKPQFPENKDPAVKFDTDNIIIELEIINPDSVSHLVIVICADESQTQCGDSQNVTDLSVGQVVVPLPPVSVKEYHIELVMYDGEDEVNKQTWIEKVPNNGGLSDGAIAGIVVAFLLVAVLIAAGFILHRKGKLPKMFRRGSDKERALVGSRRTNKRFKDVALAGVSNEYIDDIPYEDTRRGGIPVAKFPAYVDQMLGDPKFFEEEYERLPQGKQFDWKDADRHSNFRDKNRFKNIMPYDRNRVKLSVLQDDPLSDYINASYIRGFTLKDKMIATIGPIPSTVVDFWRMVWEKQVPLIVMLTNCVEVGGKKKCAQYWPLEIGAGPVTHGTFTITMTKEDVWPDYTIRSLTITKKGESRRVAHCHFTAWQDHHVPECGTSLLAFRRIVSKKMIPDRYTVIHCSAGVGRTGTLIGLDYLIKQAESEQHVDVFRCVEEMRIERVQMVQTARQYVFLHKALAQYFTTGGTAIDCHDFPDTYLKLTKPAKSGPNRIARQLEMLDKLSPTIHESDKENAFQGPNRDKNRDKAVIPLLSSRVILTCDTPGSSDYINAVSVHGCKQMKAFLVTQVPLEKTVTDFWRLMMDNTSSTVVLLVTDQQYKTMPAFLPTSDKPSIEANGHLMTLTESTRNPGYTVNKIEMGPAKPAISFPTQDNVYMNFAGASKGPAVPPSRTRPLNVFVVHLAVNKQDIDPVCTLRVITEMKKWMEYIPDKSTTVVCWDGATYSGQFVACCNLVEMMSAEQEVDVFTIVKQIRDKQPMFVSNMVQYRGLHEVIKQYLEQSSLYANL